MINVDIPNAQVIYVAEKAVEKLVHHFLKHRWWFLYRYNDRHNRHEFMIAVGVDLIKDIPAKLNNYITPEHEITRGK